MHNLIALSLALPGTPLHGLDDFEPRSRETIAPLPSGLGPQRASTEAARRGQPQAARGRRFAARVRRPAPS